MKITATFKGANGSLGYLTGETYTLLLQVDTDKVIIQKIDASGSLRRRCKYKSLKSFLNNWEVI